MSDIIPADALEVNIQYGPKAVIRERVAIFPGARIVATRFGPNGGIEVETEYSGGNIFIRRPATGRTEMLTISQLEAIFGHIGHPNALTIHVMRQVA